ncbi:MAG: type III-B CRISPR module RAMP protein Cmr6 [Methanotrichaceae archaeon]
MADSCRAAIASWWGWEHPPGSNAGLLRDRYLKIAVKDKKNHPDARKELFEEMRQSLVQLADVYKSSYDRQIACLPKPKSDGLFRTMGRMVIGLGGENVLETGLTLHHTYGTPLIPGTALKGLASHYCDQVWGICEDDRGQGFKRWMEGISGGEYHKALFGTTEDSGHIIFHDAWITPNTLVDSLQNDVMTPHHGEYYSDEFGTTPPTDFDDPNPVTFLSIVGSFHIAVSCDVPGENGQKWANLAFNLLAEALEEWGIGGKTNAGYGRLTRSTGELKPMTATKAMPRAQEATKVAEPNIAESMIRRPMHKKGDVVSVTREADPNVKRGKPYFRADDGFGGFIQFGNAPSLEIGKKTRLEIAGVMNEGYAFAVPGSKDDYLRNKGKRGRR